MSRWTVMNCKFLRNCPSEQTKLDASIRRPYYLWLIWKFVTSVSRTSKDCEQKKTVYNMFLNEYTLTCIRRWHLILSKNALERYSSDSKRKRVLSKQSRKQGSCDNICIHCMLVCMHKIHTYTRACAIGGSWEMPLLNTRQLNEPHASKLIDVSELNQSPVNINYLREQAHLCQLLNSRWINYSLPSTRLMSAFLSVSSLCVCVSVCLSVCLSVVISIYVVTSLVSYYYYYMLIRAD
jgi:hypothetical protein